MTRSRFAILVPLVALAGACGGDEGHHPTPNPLPPVAVGSRLAYLDMATSQAFIVDPALVPLQARTEPVGQNPVSAVPRPGRDELLVLARGVPDEPGLTPEPATLSVVPTEAGKTGRRHALTNRFGSMAVSPDGRFVVLHHAPQGGDPSLLVNPNEVAVLDLEGAAPGAAPAPSRALRSYGGVPEAVVFSPPLALGGPTPRMVRLAVVLSKNYVTLLDLDHDRTEITISLTRADEPQTVRPLQVLFEAGSASAAGASDPTLFIRSEGSNDIVALRLTPAPLPLADRGNDFRPVLSLLGSGAYPSDMALYQASEGSRLLLLSPDRGQAAVIDARTSRVVTFDLEARAERILLFEGSSPAESARRPRALLLSADGGQIGFLDLDRLEELKGRNLELRPMSTSVREFLPLADRGVVLANHGTNGPSVAGLSVIDLNRRTVSPLGGDPLHQIKPAPAPADEMWLLPYSATRVGRLALSRLTASEVRLDLPAAGIFPLDPSAGGKRFVVVDHQFASGALTVLDAEKPERETARSLVGFLYTGLFDRSQP